MKTAKDGSIGQFSLRQVVSKSFQDGRNAALAGHSSRVCPHFGGRRYMLWLAGWRVGQREVARKHLSEEL